MFDILDKHGFCCNVVDMTISKKIEPGTRFGRLTVVGLDHIREQKKPAGYTNHLEYYLCVCDCGNKCVRLKEHLKRKNSPVISCGCAQRESAVLFCKNRRTHGMTKTRLYRIWFGMQRRCYCKKHHNYKYYGAKGIRICDEWLHTFENFRDWAMSHGYADNLTIDRIDSNKDYCPENCQWMTMAEQNRKHANCHWVLYKGKKMIMADVQRALNMKPTTFARRFRKGLIPDVVDLQPTQHQ